MRTPGRFKWLEPFVASRDVAVVAAWTIPVLATFDAIILPRQVPRPLLAAWDEPAHVATTLLSLQALRQRPPPTFVAGALLASVAIDADHIPEILRLPFFHGRPGRPNSHSLSTVLAILLLGQVIPRWQTGASGAAFGLLVHLARDLATGLIPVLWPIHAGRFGAPYWTYLVALATLSAWSITYRQDDHAPDLSGETA